MSGCNSFTSKGFISQTKSTDPLFKIKKQFVEIKKTFEIRKLSNPVYCWLSFIHVCQYLTENFDYSSNFIVSVYNLFFPFSTFSCHSKSLSGSCNWFLQIFRFKCSPKKHSRLESEKIPKRLPNVWQFFFFVCGIRCRWFLYPFVNWSYGDWNLFEDNVLATFFLHTDFFLHSSEPQKNTPSLCKHTKLMDTNCYSEHICF